MLTMGQIRDHPRGAGAGTHPGHPRGGSRVPWMLPQPRSPAVRAEPALPTSSGEGAAITPLSSGLQNERLQSVCSNLGHAGCPQDVTAQSWQGVFLASPQPDLSHLSSCLHFVSSFFQFIQENSSETLTVRLPAFSCVK